MINVNKNVLFFIGMLSSSNFLAASDPEIVIRFTDGGELASTVKGHANFVGQNGSDDCILSGTVEGRVKITSGNVQAASPDSFGAHLVTFSEDGAGNPRSLEATAAMDLPDLTMDANGTVTADADVNLGLVSGSHDLSLDGPGQFTTTKNSRTSPCNVNVNGAGGLKVASLSNKLPAGTIAVAADSKVELGSGLSVGEGDVAASGKWSYEDGATIVLRNGADMHFDPKVHK